MESRHLYTHLLTVLRGRLHARLLQPKHRLIRTPAREIQIRPVLRDLAHVHIWAQRDMPSHALELRVRAEASGYMSRRP